MKNNKPQSNARREDTKQQTPSKHEKYGYIYLVKSPASNELTVCAFHRKLEREEKVVFPSRFGLDYGVIVGSAMEMGQYQPGSVECHGATLHGDCIKKSESEVDELLASSDDLGIEIPEENELVTSKEEAQEVEFESDMVEITGEIDWIDHVVTEKDRQKFNELSVQEDEALILCREKIVAHKLDMKLVSAHYLFGEPKIIFFFTSANRVDFRELVRDLVSIFRIRIELRQIGVRDESRVLGGLAVCGRDYCCHCLADKMNPVSIKMAKEQNLSLNSTKISGPCGRLLCCLSYEYDFYVEEKKGLPPEGSKLRILHETMRISDVNILSRKITVTSIDGRSITIPFNKLTYDTQHHRWDVDRAYLEEILSP